MGAINLMMEAAVDAINDLGADIDAVNDGYHFKADPNTRSADDITIRAGDNEFVLAIVWKKLKGYEPSCPNLGQAIRNSGNVVIRKEDLDDLKQSLDWSNQRENENVTWMKKARSFLELFCKFQMCESDDDNETFETLKRQVKDFLK